MDPDSWPIIQLVISLLALFLSCINAGVVLEASTTKEIQKSGVGLSLKAVASILWSLVFAVLSVVYIARLSTSLSHLIINSTVDLLSSRYPFFWANALGVVIFIVFALFATTVFVFLPLSWGIAHSDGYSSDKNLLLKPVVLFIPLAYIVTSFARKIIDARGMADEIGGVTEEDVLELVDTVEELDVIDETQKEMIGNIFEFDDVTASDIMTHRTEIEAVASDASVADIMNLSINLGYSRIPVYEGNLDRIIGIAYVKDFLPYVGKNTESVKITELLRNTIFIPETRKAKELLLEFKQKKIQLAVVVDEYGGTSGIVTMEDIIECIVGDIEDEYDEDEQSLVSVNSDGSLTCDGYAEIEDVFKHFDIEPPEDIESDTIGGLFCELLTRIPGENEHPSVEVSGLKLTSLSCDERRIKGVRVEKLSD